MDLSSVNRSPKEEGELEDGEICDDETEENVLMPLGDGRPSSISQRTQKPPNVKHPHNMLPLMAHPTPDFRMLMPYSHGPRLRGPFPPSHRQQCGPSGPDRPPPPPPPGHGPHGEPSPRSNFWERSHSALGRFRHRTVPNGVRGDWNRGGWGEGNIRPPPGRYGPGESHGNKKDSPTRKRIIFLIMVLLLCSITVICHHFR